MRLLRFSLLLTQALASRLTAPRHDSSPQGFALRPSRRSSTLSLPNCTEPVQPKVFIISLFESERNTWFNHTELDILAQNITVPGFSPLFPDAHCTANGNICLLTTGEGEINAAATLTALWLSPLFDLTTTYFLIAGIAGIDPNLATTGSVTFAHYAVQFDLQYEFDRSQVPANWSTGYVPQGSKLPDTPYIASNYPGTLYGTELYILNDNLKELALSFALRANLSDSTLAQSYRTQYPSNLPASQPPSIVACDTGTSNTYWSGLVLGEAFSAYTKLLTNGSGTYCATQQEDNAVLEALLRGDTAGKIDFARIIVMRSASDFDREAPGESATEHLLNAKQGGFEIAVENLWRAGWEVVQGVLSEWEEKFERGVKEDGYVGGLLRRAFEL